MGNAILAPAKAQITAAQTGHVTGPGAWPGQGSPSSREEEAQAGRPGGLTESSFHVMARTGFGIPDQLNFRNSSVDEKETGTGLQTASKLPLCGNVLHQLLGGKEPRT